MTDETSDGAKIVRLLPQIDDDAAASAPFSEEDQRVINSGPAAHANKVYMQLTEAGVRLTFTEVLGKSAPPEIRGAVLLSRQNAIRLADLLMRGCGHDVVARSPEPAIGKDRRP